MAISRSSRARSGASPRGRWQATRSGRARWTALAALVLWRGSPANAEDFWLPDGPPWPAAPARFSCRSSFLFLSYENSARRGGSNQTAITGKQRPLPSCGRSRSLTNLVGKAHMGASAGKRKRRRSASLFRTPKANSAETCLPEADATRLRADLRTACARLRRSGGRKPPNMSRVGWPTNHRKENIQLVTRLPSLTFPVSPV